MFSIEFRHKKQTVCTVPIEILWSFFHFLFAFILFVWPKHELNQSDCAACKQSQKKNKKTKYGVRLDHNANIDKTNINSAQKKKDIMFMYRTERPALHTLTGLRVHALHTLKRIDI